MLNKVIDIVDKLTVGNASLEKALNEDKIRINFHRMQETSVSETKEISNSKVPLIREVLVRIEDENGKMVSPGERGDGGFLDGAPVEQRQRLTQEILNQLFKIMSDPDSGLSGSRFSVNLGTEELSDDQIASFIKNSIEKESVNAEMVRDSLIFEILEDVDTTDENILENISGLHKTTGSTMALDDFSPDRDLEEVLGGLQKKGVKVDIVKIVHDDWSDDQLVHFFHQAAQYGVEIVIEKITIEGIEEGIRSQVDNILEVDFSEKTEISNIIELRVKKLMAIAKKGGFQRRLLIQSYETHRGENLPKSFEEISEKMKNNVA